MAFYLPISNLINSKPVIIYPEKGVEKLLNRQRHECIEKHLEGLYKVNKKDLTQGDYHLVMVWSDGEDIMSDIWIYENLSNWKDNPTLDVKNFRGFDLEEGYGVTAGDGLILLGKEEEFRRIQSSLETFFVAERTFVDGKLIVNEDFYL